MTGTDTQNGGTQRTIALLAVAVLALVLIPTLETGPTAAASPCRVTNKDSEQTYPRLQQAVDAAKPGTRLVVAGKCHGGTFIDKNLAILGVTNQRTGKPTLDGDAKARVLTIKPGVKVSIRSLVIEDGGSTRNPNGGGVSNKGRLTLTDVIVRDNRATDRGGGVYNEGALRIRGKSQVSGNGLVSGNRATNSGGGVHNAGRLVIGDSARIYRNLCGGLHNVGTAVMNRTSNIGSNNFGGRYCGGNTNLGSLVMNDASSITFDYGGVSNPGTMTMNDASSIHDNGGRGGVNNAGSLTMNDQSSIHHNQSGVSYLNASGYGAGVLNAGILTMNDQSSIHHNDAFGHVDPGRGGGVLNEPTATFTMTGASRVHDNEAWAASLGSAGLGGGLHNASGGILVGLNCGGNVYGNTPDDCYIEP